MNRLPHLITQSIDWNDGLIRSIMDPFSFFWYFSLENCIWPPFFVHYLHTSGETTSWIILVCLLRLACLFLAGRYIATSSWSSTSRMELYIFLMTRFSTSFYIASYGAAIRFLFWTFSLFFFFRLFYLSTQFLCFDPFFCHLLVTLFPSFWLFLVLFWMLWMLDTVHKTCHKPHAARITTSGTIFSGIFFDVSKDWVTRFLDK